MQGGHLRHAGKALAGSADVVERRPRHSGGSRSTAATIASTAVRGSTLRSWTPRTSSASTGSAVIRSSILVRARAPAADDDLSGQVAASALLELTRHGKSVAVPGECLPEGIDTLCSNRLGQHDRRLSLGVRTERHHGANVVQQRLCAGLIHLVDRDHVGDLHDPGLQGLHRIAGARHQHEQHLVGDAHHFDLALTGTDRLEEDHVAAGRVQEEQRLERRLGEAAEVTPRSHRPDEHTRIEKVIDESNPVSEQGSLRERARGIDGDDAHGEPEAPDMADERSDERRLPDARRPRDPDGERPAGLWVELRDDRRRVGVAVLHERDRARERPVVTGANAGNELRAGEGMSRHRRHSTARARPFWTADAVLPRL